MSFTVTTTSMMRARTAPRGTPRLDPRQDRVATLRARAIRARALKGDDTRDEEVDMVAAELTRKRKADFSV